MAKRRKIIVIAKQNEYNEERWKYFITALAYALHEQRKKREVEAEETPEAGREERES